MTPQPTSHRYAKKCQYCDTTKNVKMWIPAGEICTECHKALNRIRLLKCGVPLVRLTKEKHSEVSK